MNMEFYNKMKKLKKNKKYNLYMSILTYIIGFSLIAFYSHFLVAAGVLFTIAGLEYEERFKSIKKDEL